MLNLKFVSTLVAAALLSMGIAGCEVIGDIGDGGSASDGKTAEVILPDSMSDSDVTVLVEASGDRRVRDAIRLMQLKNTEEFEEAIDLLEEALAEDPDDHRALFALGVCYEWLGDREGYIEKAVEMYKRANLAKSNPLYQQAHARASGWLVDM